MSKGKLVRVELQPGRFMKMYESDAAARGLIPTKARPAAENKLRAPIEDKSVERGAESVERGPAGGSVERVEAPQVADDFTKIAGVGPASARALAARGITTFEQLRQVKDLSYLTFRAQEAVENWKNKS